jgi:hypothetical protein
MRFLDSFPRLNTVILLLFFVFWLYTEIQESKARNEWQEFTRAGARFTADDGARMSARIDRLEREIDELSGD